MSTQEETVTRESGYLVIFEPASGAATIERLDTLKEIAHWAIDSCDYYMSHDTVQELREITESGGVATVELEGSIRATLTIAHSAPAEAP